MLPVRMSLVIVFQNVLGHPFPACPWPWLSAGPSCLPCAAPQPDPALLTPIGGSTYRKSTLSRSHLADTRRGGDLGTTFSQSHLHNSIKGPFPLLPMHGSKGCRSPNFTPSAHFLAAVSLITAPNASVLISNPCCPSPCCVEGFSLLQANLILKVLRKYYKVTCSTVNFHWATTFYFFLVFKT